MSVISWWVAKNEMGVVTMMSHRGVSRRCDAALLTAGIPAAAVAAALDAKELWGEPALELYAW